MGKIVVVRFFFCRVYVHEVMVVQACPGKSVVR